MVPLSSALVSLFPPALLIELTQRNDENKCRIPSDHHDVLQF